MYDTLSKSILEWHGNDQVVYWAPGQREGYGLGILNPNGVAWDLRGDTVSVQVSPTNPFGERSIWPPYKESWEWWQWPDWQDPFEKALLHGNPWRLKKHQVGNLLPTEYKYDSLGSLSQRGVEPSDLAGSGVDDPGGSQAVALERWQPPYLPLGRTLWFFTYTANGERSQWFSSYSDGQRLAGDVNGDGCVTDADVGRVLARYGQSCSGCAEDLNGDGVVNDEDVGLVMSHYGMALWEYAYDPFGNLVRARSGCAGSYDAGYNGLGRRVWQEVNGVRTYFLYDGDTLTAEVDASSGQVVAEYVWGLQGPLARLDLQNPANTRYYVLDGLGHTRLLLDSLGDALTPFPSPEASGEGWREATG